MSTLSAGLGFKPAYLEEALTADRAGLWFEVHPENYLADGGPRPRMLEALAAAHPLSLHGVSMSLAGAEPPDAGHLRAFAALVKRLNPALVSEHLAWSRSGARYEPDLLPFVRDNAALQRVSAHVQQVQEAIGRPLALENPSHYLALQGHSWDEVDFLHELVRRTDCRLLVDVSNVHLSAHNLGYAAADWLDRVKAEAIVELHLAGHALDPGLGDALWIDSHDAPVHAQTWVLFERLVQRIGARPTLIEWDARLPPFARAERAAGLLPPVKVLA
jgi:uncharacterized protein (UPF0276 family)